MSSKPACGAGVARPAWLSAERLAVMEPLRLLALLFWPFRLELLSECFSLFVRPSLSCRH